MRKVDRAVYHNFTSKHEFRSYKEQFGDLIIITSINYNEFVVAQAKYRYNKKTEYSIDP